MPPTISISMHAEETDETDINHEKSPRKETAPGENEMNNLYGH
jgi:hypothetical protein